MLETKKAYSGGAKDEFDTEYIGVLSGIGSLRNK